MKNVLTATFLTCICITGSAQINHGYPIDPVPFTSVKVTDNFWGQRLQASREVTIPLAFSKCEETGRYENFVKASQRYLQSRGLLFRRYRCIQNNRRSQLLSANLSGQETAKVH